MTGAAVLRPPGAFGSAATVSQSMSNLRPYSANSRASTNPADSADPPPMPPSKFMMFETCRKLLNLRELDLYPLGLVILTFEIETNIMVSLNPFLKFLCHLCVCFLAIHRFGVSPPPFQIQWAPAWLSKSIQSCAYASQACSQQRPLCKPGNRAPDRLLAPLCSV